MVERLSKVRRKEKTRTPLAEWFSGASYRAGEQPWTTAAKNQGFRGRAESDLSELVGKAFKDAHVIEVGPGFLPLTEGLGFGKTVYVDQSKMLLQKLKHSFRNFYGNSKNRKEFFVHGDIRSLPRQLNQRYDIGILPEVLTHVEPQKRGQVVLDLAKRCNALYVVDRPNVSVEEYARHMLGEKVFADYVKADGKLDWKKVDANMNLSAKSFLRSHQIRRLTDKLPEYVRFDKVEADLKKLGFRVERRKEFIFPVLYEVLKAKRLR